MERGGQWGRDEEEGREGDGEGEYSSTLKILTKVRFFRAHLFCILFLRAFSLVNMTHGATSFFHFSKYYCYKTSSQPQLFITLGSRMTFY